MSGMALLIKNIEIYRAFKPLYVEYKKSRDKEKYLRGHEHESILFEAAARALKAAGVTGKLPDISKLKEDYAYLAVEKDKLYSDYGKPKKRLRKCDAAMQNVDSILSPARGVERDKSL